MQLNKEGIYRIVQTFERIADGTIRHCCGLFETDNPAMKRHPLLSPVVGVLLPQACDRCKAEFAFVQWIKEVWVKYAAKEWKFQAAFVPRSFMDGFSTGFKGMSSITERGRFYITQYDLEYRSDGNYDNSFDMRFIGDDVALSPSKIFVSMKLKATDTDWSRAVPQRIEMNFHGRAFDYAGRAEARTVEAEIFLERYPDPMVEKDGVVFVNQDEAVNELRDLWDWWRSNPRSIPKQLNRLSVKQALDGHAKWVEKMRKKTKPTQALTKEDKTYLGELVITHRRLMKTFEGKLSLQRIAGRQCYEDVEQTYKVYTMNTAAALAEEGYNMHNCIGGYAHALAHSSFASIVGTNRNDSYSVHYRKPLIEGAEIVVLQARGFANRTLESSEQRQIAAGLTRLTHENNL